MKITYIVLGRPMPVETASQNRFLWKTSKVSKPESARKVEES
jgi:hypothetical protein